MLIIKRLKYSTFFVFIVIVSTIVKVRFLYKIVKMLELECKIYLFYSTFSVLVSILIIEIIINSNHITKSFFQYKTESKVIQIFMFYMIVLTLLFVLFMYF